MSNTTDNIFELTSKRRHAVCRTAYTLNGAQPVRCTLIGEEPLFFMDFEGEFAEEAAFDDAFGFQAIEEGLHELQRKIEVLDRLSQGPEQPAALAMEQFLEDSLTIGEFRNGGEETISLARLTAIMRRSRLAAAYLDFAANFGTTIQHGTQQGDAFYDRASGVIFVNPALSEADQILLLSRELRRVWQHRNGALVQPLMFHPEQAILINRAQVADLTVSMVRIAWELQLANEKKAWERLEASSMVDLGRAFARESCLDFRTLNNGGACSAVFEAWFLSDRCSIEDRRIIQNMLADFQGYVFDSESPSKAVGAELIAALGSMPFGKNYLAPYVQTIISDPVFTEVRDRSNANFLWFIKFERTFRETEQELQTDQSAGHGGLHGHSQNQKRIGEHEKTADIVALPGGRPASSSPAGKLNGTGAQIIEFRHRQSAD